VRVRTEDESAGEGVPLLRQDLMADSNSAIIEVLYPLIGDELPDLLVPQSILLGGSGDRVIKNDHKPVRVLHPLNADLSKDLADRCGIIMRHAEVGRDLHDLADFDVVKTRLLREDLLSKRHSHRESPLWDMCLRNRVEVHEVG